MTISKIVFFWGKKCPDPGYKNLYFYPDYESTSPTVTDNERPYLFLHNFTVAGGIEHYTFTPVNPLYCVSENEKSFSLDIPNNANFPNPIYMALETVSGWRYAFIIGKTLISQNKYRVTCLFDQWAEHYPELINHPMNISRRHQNRFFIDTNGTYRNIYNGIPDPVPASMVYTNTKTAPVEIFGAKTYGTTARIPVWLYWRLTTDSYFEKIDTPEGTWSEYQLNGIDADKKATPFVATFLGVIEYEYNTTVDRSSYFRGGYQVLNSSDVSVSVTQTMQAVEDLLRVHSSYISESFLSTKPPYPCEYVYISGQGYSVKVDTGYIGTVSRNGYKIRIGSDSDETGIDISNTLSFVSTTVSRFGTVEYENVLVTTNEAPNVRTRYEPKVEETDFEHVMLKYSGADIDISPAPGRDNLGVSIPILSHSDGMVFREYVDNHVTKRVEIGRLKGLRVGLPIDIVNDTLEQFMVSNRETYQNALLMKGIFTATSAVASIATGNVGGVVSGVLSGVQQYTGHKAKMSDLMESPNSATVPTDNAFDNFPYIDHPIIEKRTLTEEAKTRIVNYWHIYGYPAIEMDTIGNTINRMSFVYYQCTPMTPVKGVLPGECDDIITALSGGSWIWRIWRSGINPGCDILEDPNTLDNEEKSLEIK